MKQSGNETELLKLLCLVPEISLTGTWNNCQNTNNTKRISNEYNVLDDNDF